MRTRDPSTRGTTDVIQSEIHREFPDSSRGAGEHVANHLSAGAEQIDIRLVKDGSAGGAASLEPKVCIGRVIKVTGCSADAQFGCGIKY